MIISGHLKSLFCANSASKVTLIAKTKLDSLKADAIPKS